MRHSPDFAGSLSARSPAVPCAAAVCPLPPCGTVWSAVNSAEPWPRDQHLLGELDPHAGFAFGKASLFREGLSVYVSLPSTQNSTAL
jgi:hypothetical protein